MYYWILFLTITGNVENNIVYQQQQIGGVIATANNDGMMPRIYIYIYYHLIDH